MVVVDHEIGILIVLAGLVSLIRRVASPRPDWLLEQYREAYMLAALSDTRLDGDNLIRDFDIAVESPETDFNKYMLMRAEQRWGDGDGIFTVEEQDLALS